MSTDHTNQTFPSYPGPSKVFRQKPTVLASIALGISITLQLSNMALALDTSPDIPDWVSHHDEYWLALENECKTLENVSYPKADQPTGKEQGIYKDCDPDNFYYGIKTRVDYRKARLCAFSNPGLYYGQDRGVLMMLYGNGQGVRRNDLLARKASCEAGGSQAELIGRMEHLKKLAHGKGSPGAKIDICDDITSGKMQGYCSGIQYERDDQVREQALAQLSAGWSHAEKLAFQKLKAQAKAFFDLRSNEEVNSAGTAYVAIAVGELSTLKLEFMKSLQEFESGTFPTYTKQEFEAADQELNALYSELKHLPDPEYGGPTLEGIQRTQRSWLAVRSRMIAYRFVE